MVTDNKSIQELDVLERLDKLEQTLLAADPQIPVHLSNILKTLQTYEELIHLLDDKKIAVLMEGMQKYKKVQLIAEAMSSKKKGLSKTTVDDL